jgi:RNA polymerase sigma-70 factor, ECF subfamily
MNSRPKTTIFLMDPDDEAVVLAAKRGDEHAFGVLVKLYQRKMFAVALRYVGIREDAEDIVQQTFQKAFVHLHDFKGKSSFSTWLTRIAMNEARMFLRKGRARREVPINDSSEGERAASALEIPDSGPDPEVNYLQRESSEVLCAAIRRLAAGLRTATELRELRELSTQEVATRMGLSLTAVKGRLFHGRRNLRKTLQRLGIAPKGVQRRPTAQLANHSCAAMCSR